MGKWCYVKCNCPDREPLPNSDLSFEPYRNKRHLNAHERKEQKEWRENVYEMHRCGHREGALVAFAPGTLFTLGDDLEKIYTDQPERFPVFRRIGDWRHYEDEYLNLPVEEAALWKKEIEQLQRYLSGEEYMGWDELQSWNEARKEEQWRYGRGGYEPDSVEERLTNALKLCEASIKTGNSVEIFW